MPRKPYYYFLYPEPYILNNLEPRLGHPEIPRCGVRLERRHEPPARGVDVNTHL